MPHYEISKGDSYVGSIRNYLQLRGKREVLHAVTVARFQLGILIAEFDLDTAKKQVARV
jgi:hypothetical protein